MATTAQRCAGRLARGKKADGISVLTFEPTLGQAKPALFFVPYRCEKEVHGGGTRCVECVVRTERTEAYLTKRRQPNGTLLYIANQDTLLHGLVTEPLPDWSHMYRSKWFEEFRVAKGLRLSEATLRRADEAWDAAHKGVVVPSASQAREMPRAKKTVAVAAALVPVAAPLMPVPEAVPAKPVAQRKPKKTVGARTAPEPTIVAPPPEPTAVFAVPEATTVAPPPEPVAAKQPKRPRAKAKATVCAPTASAPTTPIGLVRGPIRDAIETVKIVVRRLELDGRTYYLDPKKDKVYDTKYNYIGRYKSREDVIDTTYPDSDLE